MNGQPKPASNEVSYDTWKILWGMIFKMYRLSYYHEKLADSLLDRLIRFDYIVTFLSVITGTVAGVAGWNLWKDEGLGFFWACGTAVAPLLVALHLAFQVPSKIRHLGDEHKDIRVLISEAEQLWNDLRLSFQDPSNVYNKLKKRHDDIFKKLESKYAVLTRVPFATKRHRRRIEDEVNRSLKVGQYAL